MLKTLHRIARTGIVTEAPPLADHDLRVREALEARIRQVLGRALCIRQVDAGSCNGCELEIHALGNPLYSIESLGIRFVASPRHADMLLVTGPVSRHMEVALKRTYDARRRRRGLWQLRRHLRRRLREPRRRLQRHPCRRRRAGLPACAHAPARGDPRGDFHGREPSDRANLINL